MDTLSYQDEGTKRASGIKALVIEVGVIVALIVMMVLILGYFNVIDISALFPKQKNLNIENSTSVSKIAEAPATQNNAGRFKDLTDEAITSAMTINQYEGVITEVVTIDEADKVQGNIRYGTTINLKGKGQNSSMILFDDKALKVAKIFEIKDGKEITLSIKDLKINDQIKIVVTRSLNFETAGYEYTEFEIERIVK